MEIVLLINSFGFIGGFFISQCNIKYEIRKMIKSGNQVGPGEKLKFSKDEFYSEKSKIKHIGEDEFIYSGRYYDIIHYEILNDSITLWCLNDKDEEKLIANFQENIKNHLNTDSPANKTRKADILKIFMFEATPHQTEEIFHIRHAGQLNNIFQSSLISIKLDIPSPPPKYC
jgi:hypothetical protein